MNSRRARRALVSLTGCTLAAALVVPGGAARAATSTVQRPDGAGPPVTASGMGTPAALDNPSCRHDDPKYGPYGRFDTTVVGGGGACVKPWKAGDNNGGATTPGVTKDRIKVVFILPDDQQFAKDPVKPTNRSTGTTGNYQDGIHDYLLPEMRFYETWGRDIEAHFFTSTGSDEQSQRADLVSITAMKPFAAINLISGEGLKVLEAGLAAAKIMLHAFATNLRFEDDEFNFVKTRAKFGTSRAFQLRDEHFTVDDAT